METLNLKRINLFIILFLLVMTSCSNNSNNDNSNNYDINEHLEYLRTFGYEFYENIDSFLLRGVNAIDTSNIKYPFYAIRVDSPFVNVQHFVSPATWIYDTFTSYKKVNDYYISTKIYVEFDLRDSFSREVTIIYPDKIILYDYLIDRNFERLTEISFLYKDGSKKVYYDGNETDSYYNICDTLNENNINIYFPSFQLE